MGQEYLSQGHSSESRGTTPKSTTTSSSDFVLEKSIFNNIFEKDIRRVFMYKKAERLAKAIYLIAPAFGQSLSLRDRVHTIAINLVDAAILPPGAARGALSRELLTLSSILAIARTDGLLSEMNADIITREAQFLLQEVAAYEEPRLALDEAPTLSGIAKNVQKHVAFSKAVKIDKRHLPPKADPPLAGKDRREAIMSVIRAKQSASIKDISLVVRGVSEKTVQRELLALIEQGLVQKRGERRWSVYSLT